MAYTPYYPGGWQSGEQGGTPITPAALNNIEDGITALSTTVDAQIPSLIFTVNSSSSKVLTFAANTRCLLFGVNQSGARFVHLAYCNANGTTNAYPVMTANNVTVTGASDYTLTIANGSGNGMACGVLIIGGSVTT